MSPKRPLPVENSPQDSSYQPYEEDDEEKEEKTFTPLQGQRQQFQRVWSPEDEICVLQGLIDFISRGMNPFSDMQGFLDVIKKSIHFDVSLAQLKDKVSKLKKKFVKKAENKNTSFSNPHDQKVYDLANKLWKATVRVRSENNDKYFDEETEPETMGVGVEDGVMEDYVVKKALRVVEGVKKAEMKEKWKKLRVAELKLFIQRKNLVREHAELLLAAQNADED